MKPVADRFIVAWIVLLSLVALWLTFSAPDSFLSVHAVYQGF